MSDQHAQSLIKTPKQLIVTIAASFLVPIAVILLLANYVSSERKTGAGSAGTGDAATIARIAPVAQFALVDPNAPRELKSGKQVFEAVCTTCHGAGIAGAPKFGDAAAWAPRIAEGTPTLYQHAINGFQGKAGVMPAKGGNTDLDDVEVQRAVVYMADAAGAKFPEPAAVAKPDASAAAAAPAAPPAPQPDPGVVATLAAINAGTPPPAGGAPATATVASAAPSGGDAADAAGKKLFESVCTACHTPGIAGAPKFGDKAAWAPRIAEGLDTLYQHAINGFQSNGAVMPAKGGSSAPDDDVKAAVRYMVTASK